MKDVYLVNYTVQGVKTLDKKVTLSFYKKLIEKKEDKNHYICNLLMKYKDYKVAAEFESTGVKKLIMLVLWIF